VEHPSFYKYLVVIPTGEKSQLARLFIHLFIYWREHSYLFEREPSLESSPLNSIILLIYPFFIRSFFSYHTKTRGEGQVFIFALWDI
jgi:hypothetical protein